MNTSSYTSTPLYILMKWCLIKLNLVPRTSAFENQHRYHNRPTLKSCKLNEMTHSEGIGENFDGQSEGNILIVACKHEELHHRSEPSYFLSWSTTSPPIKEPSVLLLSSQEQPMIPILSYTIPVHIFAAHCMSSVLILSSKWSRPLKFS
jgi:hypothetical protein